MEGKHQWKAVVGVWAFSFLAVWVAKDITIFTAAVLATLFICGC